MTHTDVILSHNMKNPFRCCKNIGRPKKCTASKTFRVSPSGSSSMRGPDPACASVELRHHMRARRRRAEPIESLGRAVLAQIPQSVLQGTERYWCFVSTTDLLSCPGRSSETEGCLRAAPLSVSWQHSCCSVAGLGHRCSWLLRPQTQARPRQRPLEERA
jgi:hypothetical protein